MLPGGNLVAIFGGTDAAVGGHLDVQENGVLILGCEPIHFICASDPYQKVGSFRTTDTVGGSLTAQNALAATTIGHNVSLIGGGGGVSCIPSPALGGGPPFSYLED